MGDSFGCWANGVGQRIESAILMAARRGRQTERGRTPPTTPFLSFFFPFGFHLVVDRSDQYNVYSFNAGRTVKWISCLLQR